MIDVEKIEEKHYGENNEWICDFKCEVKRLLLPGIPIKVWQTNYTIPSI